jgi:N-sulfoglucosamine sulfohydrolase
MSRLFAIFTENLRPHSRMSRDLTCVFPKRWPGLSRLAYRRFVPGGIAILMGLVMATTANSRRPDIVYFIADDWGREAGVYREEGRATLSDMVSTPVIDRIARQGVVFENAFFDAPQCSPSRGAIVTGNVFWRNGSSAIQRGGTWEDDENPFLASPRFPDLLAGSGYLTARAYKTLPFKPSAPAASTEGLDSFLRYGLHVSGGADAREQADRRATVLQETRDAIRRVIKACPSGQPFFFVVGPFNTHRPFAPGSGERLWGFDLEKMANYVPAHLPNVETIRRDLADYLGEVQAVDLMLGVLVEELQAMGRWDNTLLVLSGDNGAPGFPRAKAQLYDMGMAAPLIVHWPGRIKPGRRVSDFVSLRDLAPTFLEVAGIAAPESMDAQSLLPQLLASGSGQIDPNRDAVVYGRERHFITAREGNLPYPARAIRTANFLYIRNFRPERNPLGDPFGLTGENQVSPETIGDYWQLGQGPFRDLDPSPTKSWLIAHRDEPLGRHYFDLAFGKNPGEELYDLRTDPEQMINLAEDLRFESIRERMATRLDLFMSKWGDPRLSHAFDYPPYVEVHPTHLLP